MNVEDTDGFAGALGKELGLEEVRTGSWFTKVVQIYLRWNQAHARPIDPSKPRHELAEKAIQRACLKTGATGFASGLTSTGAAVLTFASAGTGALVGIPATAVGLLGDVLYRALVHIDLTCELGAIYGVTFDPEDPADLLRLYSFVFQDEPGERPAGGARGLVERVLMMGDDRDVGLRIGKKLVGQALRRNVVPVVGVITSTIGNVKTTRRLGETVQRYVSYQRALQDAIGDVMKSNSELADLLVEGVWFVLTADGQMRPEEAAILAWMLQQLPSATEQGAVRRRFIEDESGWHERLAGSPAAEHERILRVLEVAAAVDHGASLPERRMLRQAARALKQDFNPGRIEGLTRELDTIR